MEEGDSSAPLQRAAPQGPGLTRATKGRVVRSTLPYGSYDRADQRRTAH